jgi:hypothetical protein
MTRMILMKLFIELDDFMKVYEPEMKKHLIGEGSVKRNRSGKLTLSEVMTLLIYFHMSGYRNFKDYYLKHALVHLKEAFPDLVSYKRFVALTPKAMLPLAAFMKSRRCGECTGISFVDSTTIEVCHVRRIHQHKVFKGLAQRGKSSTGWFYGFKLHLVVNELGEIVNFVFSPGNVDDRNENLMGKLTQKLFGKLFGDKGYLSKKLFEFLWSKGIQMITKLKRNMKKLDLTFRTLHQRFFMIFDNGV